MKKVIIFESDSAQPHSPVKQRMGSYKNELNRLGYDVIFLPFPKGVSDLLRVAKYIYLAQYRTLIISCPSFSNMKYLLFPFCHKVLDIRDGWSIAIKSGYGGIKRPSYLKYIIASIVEMIAICFASEVVTVTQGLKEHLDKRSFKKCTLIENGYVGDSVEEIELQGLDRNKIIAVCAGKFSEYGNSNVIEVLSKLVCVYGEKFGCIEIHLIGCEYEKNIWLEEYITIKYPNKLKLYIHQRMQRSDLEIFLSGSDVGLVVLRDDNYEYGTKVFDYIKFGLDIVGNFDRESSFSLYFYKYLNDKALRNLYSRDYRMKKTLIKVLK